MGHTYTSLLYHIVFSTKGRRAWLKGDVWPELTRFTGGILRKRQGTLLAMNGVADHAHLLGLFHPKQALSEQMRDIKAVSSRWIHENLPGLKEFAWQSGYSAFSVSKSNGPAVAKYIAAQQEHHNKMSFEDELIALLKKHAIEYDPQYVLD